MRNIGSLFAVANWHANKAIEAYLSGEMDLYTRHIFICDELRRKAYAVKRLLATEAA